MPRNAKLIMGSQKKHFFPYSQLMEWPPSNFVFDGGKNNNYVSWSRKFELRKKWICNTVLIHSIIIISDNSFDRNIWGVVGSRVKLFKFEVWIDRNFHWFLAHHLLVELPAWPYAPFISIIIVKHERRALWRLCSIWKMFCYWLYGPFIRSV